MSLGATVVHMADPARWWGRWATQHWKDLSSSLSSAASQLHLSGPGFCLLYNGLIIVVTQSRDGAKRGGSGESDTDDRVGASCCLGGPGGFLEQVLSKLRPGGGERFGGKRNGEWTPREVPVLWGPEDRPM